MRVIGPSATNGAVPPKAFGRSGAGTRPHDPLNPYTPHQAAGIRMEPPASVPSAKGTNPSATAAALPPDEPPVLRDRSNGLHDGPNNGLSHVPRIPITGLLVLPTMMAPARSTRSANMQ